MTRDYRSTDDPYCHPGSGVLRNKAGATDQAALDALEKHLTSIRFEEPLPEGLLDTGHYRAMHRHLFQDVFDWAGEYRTVRIAKGGSMFCYPEYINAEMERIFAALRKNILAKLLSRRDFASGAAQFLAELNAVRPFREGNGRAQLAFLTVLTEEAGHPLDLEHFHPERLLAAMITSYKTGDTNLLEAEILARKGGI